MVACHTYLKKEHGSKNIIMQKLKKKLQRGHTTGAPWLQFCRGATEKEGNLSLQMALRYSQTELHVNYNNNGEIFIFISHGNYF